MTVTISPQTEALLKEQAGRMGQDTDALADTLLQHALTQAAHAFAESCAAIAEALAGDPVHDIPLEYYREQFEAGRTSRRGKREAA